MTPEILISEVGPRDGLQNCKSIMATKDKIAWIEAEVRAGVREIEVGSFVPAKLLPQLADTADLVRHARTIEGLTVAVLVPNLHGVKAAVEAGAHKMSLPLSVSETHSLKNLRRSHQQVLAEIGEIQAFLADIPADRRPHFEVSLSTVFGCTMEGVVPESKILSLTEKLVDLDIKDIGLSDTTGYANPAQVKRMIRAVRSVAGADRVTGIHLHNTRGLGIANALAAYEEGITTFDASLGGLGGCPFAPGASGNIVTEDLAFMFEAMGVNTGINVAELIKVREILARALPDETLYGFTPDAGLPKGFDCVAA
ncbi:MAG: hydroxymethylglutaryl-CoA lyase [Alphaproteobacteria bacterium]|nr:MAG: hydroxymethylglutaryl-CoA lyase [Alphaproteobacteria bacterium]